MRNRQGCVLRQSPCQECQSTTARRQPRGVNRATSTGGPWSPAGARQASAHRSQGANPAAIAYLTALHSGMQKPVKLSFEMSLP